MVGGWLVRNKKKTKNRDILRKSSKIGVYREKMMVFAKTEILIHQKNPKQIS